MKLNVGDVVELQFEGSTLSGVVTAVTPERVELMFTYNLFIEGPSLLTWGDGTQQPVKIGLDNGVTKLQLRLPLEEVARAQAMNMASATWVPTSAAQPAVAAPEPAPIAEQSAEPPAAEIADPDADPEPGEPDLFSGAALDTEALHPGSTTAPTPVARPPVPTPSGILTKAEQRIARPGIWVDYEARIDGFDPKSGGSFVGTTTKICVAGSVMRLESGSLKIGSRVQILFAIERDTFDLPAIVMGQEGKDLFALQYDEPEARPRLLKAVLALSKSEVRPSRGWR